MAKKKNRILTLAHVDEPGSTYKDVEIPHVVPLYVDLDEARSIGRAFLTPGEGRVWAKLEVDAVVTNLGPQPATVLALEGETTYTSGGVRYICGGLVTGASIVTQELWDKIHGGQVS